MANLTIGISDLKVCRPPDVLVTYALGSCVGICLLDSVADVGGLSHIMLPDSTQATNGAATPMRFADTAIPMLIREMVKLGTNLTYRTPESADRSCYNPGRRKYRLYQGIRDDNEHCFRGEHFAVAV